MIHFLFTCGSVAESKDDPQVLLEILVRLEHLTDQGKRTVVLIAGADGAFDHPEDHLDPLCIHLEGVVLRNPNVYRHFEVF